MKYLRMCGLFHGETERNRMQEFSWAPPGRIGVGGHGVSYARPTEDLAGRKEPSL